MPYSNSNVYFKAMQTGFIVSHQRPLQSRPAVAAEVALIPNYDTLSCNAVDSPARLPAVAKWLMRNKEYSRSLLDMSLHTFRVGATTIPATSCSKDNNINGSRCTFALQTFRSFMILLS